MEENKNSTNSEKWESEKRGGEEKEEEVEGIPNSAISEPGDNVDDTEAEQIYSSIGDETKHESDAQKNDECALLVEKLENVELGEEDGAEDDGEKEEGGGAEESGGDKVGGSGGDGGEGDELESRYPLRPGAVDCGFYLKTGTCKFGVNCRFNHPMIKVEYKVNGTDKEKEVHGSSEDAGKIQCRYHLMPGGCKYGDSCRYDHSKIENDTEPQLNFLGLPIRLGEKECPFYMRNGSCGYEAKCRFHHPDPTEANGKPNSRAYNDRAGHSSASYIDTYSSGLSQALEPVNGTTSGSGSFSCPFNSLPGTLLNSPSTQYQGNPSAYLQLKQAGEFPERPGQPECAYFIKTGYCKYKSACKYHHPKNGSENDLNKEGHSNWDGQDSSTQYQQLMQFTEFPERPSQPECEYFMRNGDCKFRSACRYHHPKSRLMQLPATHLMLNNGMPSKIAPVSSVANSNLPYINSKYVNKKPEAFKHQQQTLVGEYPERPGEPDCDFYVRTGDCKYKSACRYHHPKSRASAIPSFTLSDKGLPLRPDSRICRNYEQQGSCKYGARCLFDHSDNISSSPSIPVVPASASPSSNSTAKEWGGGWFIG